MDLAQFVSDYVRMLRDNGSSIPPRRQLAQEIAEAYGEYVPETAEMSDDAYLAWATQLAPQVEYYLN